MILFVFEGRKTEPALFKTLEHLYFNNPNEKKVCCFGYNIYELYRLMTESDFTEDIVTVIKRKLESRNEKPISDELSITDFDGINAYTPRTDNSNDEIFTFDEKTRKKISNYWSKVKIEASNAN